VAEFRNPLAGVAGASEAALSPLLRIMGVSRQRDALGETGHRPWPIPDRPWFMGQTWCDLLFAHWRVPREELERVVPPQLPIDSFDGSAWLGVTPFLVSGLRIRGTLPVPVLSRFPELNVRTYVSVEGKPGIYFLSLDAASRAAVATARRVYRLPYHHAEMTQERAPAAVRFSSTRVSRDGPPAAFRGSYRPAGSAPVVGGSLEYYLAERYCLYTLDERQRVLRGDIHHPPWPLQPAEAEFEVNTMTCPFEIRLEGEPILHFSRRQDVVLWGLHAVGE
jgi:uncharacterized protein YqjF (DUF2071 family)